MNRSANSQAKLARTVALIVLSMVTFVFFALAIWHTGPEAKEFGGTGGLLLVPLFVIALVKGVLDHRWFEGW